MSTIVRHTRVQRPNAACAFNIELINSLDNRSGLAILQDVFTYDKLRNISNIGRVTKNSLIKHSKEH